MPASSRVWVPAPSALAQLLQRVVLLGGERWGTCRARAYLDVLGARGRDATFAPAQAAGGGGWENQPERTGERRAVLGGEPLGKRDQIDGDAELERTQRREQLLLGDLAVIRQPRDDTEDLAAPERHHEHRANLDARRATPLVGGNRTARATRGPSSLARPGLSLTLLNTKPGVGPPGPRAPALRTGAPDHRR